MDGFRAFDRPDGIYLLNHSVGVPPSSLPAGIADELLTPWLSDPERSWPRWTEELVGFHHELARLFNHEAKWFCHQVNVSSGVTKILHALPLTAGRPVILFSERTFPSLGYVAQAAEAVGYEPRMLPTTFDSADPNRWADAIGDDVGVVLVGHAESNTGTCLPVGEIVELARSAGAVSIVDVAQSAGVVPIDLAALDQWIRGRFVELNSTLEDLYWEQDDRNLVEPGAELKAELLRDGEALIGTSVKWLCGGPGAGFLWVNPEMIERCAPVDVGWFSHEDPFEFDIRTFRRPVPSCGCGTLTRRTRCGSRFAM
jgi:kynureninase